MASLSRLSRDIPSVDNYRIYVPFCTKNSTIIFIDCHTPSTNSWHRVTSIPQYCQSLVLKDFSMVSMGHHIYIIGGRLCRKLTGHNVVSISQETNPRVVPFVYRYDIRTDNWDKCSPMMTPRYDFACTVSNNKIYIAGGQSTLGGAKGISSAEVYDPALDQWKSVAPMSTMRYKCVAVTWQGKIHIMGGFVDGGEHQGPYITFRSSAEVYDAENDKWDFMARMWALDVPPYQIIALNGKLFSCGDCFQPWKGHIEAYDEKEKIWDMVYGSHLHCLSPICTTDQVKVQQPMQRLYLTMAPIGNKLYFLTGHKASGEVSRLMSQVHVFDTALNGDGWQSRAPIEEDEEKELCGHGCVLRYDS